MASWENGRGGEKGFGSTKCDWWMMYTNFVMCRIRRHTVVGQSTLQVNQKYDLLAYLSVPIVGR